MYPNLEALLLKMNNQVDLKLHLKINFQLLRDQLRACTLPITITVRADSIRILRTVESLIYIFILMLGKIIFKCISLRGL